MRSVRFLGEGNIVLSEIPDRIDQRVFRHWIFSS